MNEKHPRSLKDIYDLTKEKISSSALFKKIGEIFRGKKNITQEISSQLPVEQAQKDVSPEDSEMLKKLESSSAAEINDLVLSKIKENLGITIVDLPGKGHPYSQIVLESDESRFNPDLVDALYSQTGYTKEKSKKNKYIALTGESISGTINAFERHSPKLQTTPEGRQIPRPFVYEFDIDLGDTTLRVCRSNGTRPHDEVTLIRTEQLTDEENNLKQKQIEIKLIKNRYKGTSVKATETINGQSVKLDTNQIAREMLSFLQKLDQVDTAAAIKKAA